MKEYIKIEDLLDIMNRNGCADCSIGSGIIDKARERGRETESASEAFAEFWSKYPRKINKFQAERVFNRLNPPLDVCIESISYMLKSGLWKTDKDHIVYIPYPSTWLNQRRWKDAKVGNVTETDKYKDDKSFEV